MNLFAILMKQDDPSKCTATKLVKFHLLKTIVRPRHDTLILNPFSRICLTRSDRNLSSALCVIDCSWERSDTILQNRKWRSYPLLRRLPALLAGNPVNYAKLGKLSSVEALSGALLIMGYNSEALAILDKFKWGHTFYELNLHVLQEYSNAENEGEVYDIQRQYFEQQGT
jgi:pre-rRNA-processing protein TSR3